MSDKDKTFTKILLIIAGALQLITTLTIVSNLGWLHVATIGAYFLTAIIGYVIYILWKS
jgi:hypothetical protein